MGEGCTALQALPACRGEEARPEATCDDAVATPAVVSPVPAEEPSPLAGLPAPVCRRRWLTAQAPAHSRHGALLGSGEVWWPVLPGVQGRKGAVRVAGPGDLCPEHGLTP